MLAVAALAIAPSVHAATITVSIRSTGFSPSTITINHDDSVRWVNNDKTSHQVVANDGSFASPILAPGKTYTFTFRRAGTFRYHDAYAPSHTGKITVKGPPPSMTFVLSQPIVVYGTQITLSGTISSQKANENVELDAQPYGQGSPTVLATVKTGTGGTYSYNVTPDLYTTYVAHWGNVTSGQLLVQVAPKVQLLAGGNGYMRAQVTGPRSFAGRHVMFQRLSAFGQWVNIRALTLGQRSGRVFKPAAFLPRGVSRIRVFLTVNQAGVGLLANHSGTQTIRRR